MASIPENMTSRRRSIGLSHTGRVRDQNQDAILTDDDLGLWLVADGLGGHAGGARASELARDSVERAIRSGGGIREAVQGAHRAIHAAQADTPEVGEMGTTMVLLRENRDGMVVAWVGDSRAYRYRPSKGGLELLTRDHNVARMLVESGAMPAGDARNHPQRHVLTECLGFVGHDEVRCEEYTDRWQPGDWILLCSDGLSNEVDEARMASILAGADDLQAAGDDLLAAALDAGGRDNVSLVLVQAPERLPRRRGWLGRLKG